jgi:hypothetical protein
MSKTMFDLSKIFDLSKKFAVPDTLHKSKNYCNTCLFNLRSES